MSIGGAIVQTFTGSSANRGYDRYANPFLGRTFRSIDQYADYQKMYADYMRNVGREIKYPSIRDYRALGGSALGDATAHVVNIGLRTSRSLL